jgi:hypothetical protein
MDRSTNYRKKFLAITCDNALANNSMVNSFLGNAARMRCFLHIISIMANTLLKHADGHITAHGY